MVTVRPPEPRSVTTSPADTCPSTPVTGSRYSMLPSWSQLMTSVCAGFASECLPIGGGLPGQRPQVRQRRRKAAFNRPVTNTGTRLAKNATAP